MKSMLPFLLLLLLHFGIIGQQPTQYDSTLAQQLGADEYGMKSCTFVLLTTGDTVINDEKRTQALFSGHMENITRLTEASKLVLAGPMDKKNRTIGEYSSLM